MINRLKKKVMAHKGALLIILAACMMQLSGCGGKCKSSSSPSSVGVVQLLGQCVLAANITCTCSGGGVLSSCSAGTQTFKQGTVPQNMSGPPCPSTFDCSSTGNCSSTL